MSDAWGDDPAGEDEEQWREHVINDAVAGEHVPTDQELDLDALEREGVSEVDEVDEDDELDEDDDFGDALDDDR
ncbi:hypothetical protein ACFQ58_14860 [Agromyces sp. NPDC056523]|uniref:hypothetical protein n=1 Tax=Agromyces sp. NPDC056523 TaxID=3345850 RepID=UPI0036721B0D